LSTVGGAGMRMSTVERIICCESRPKWRAPGLIVSTSRRRVLFWIRTLAAALTSCAPVAVCCTDDSAPEVESEMPEIRSMFASSAFSS
jgi:hypothetical protein